jgi:hypothetical protein
VLLKPDAVKTELELAQLVGPPGEAGEAASIETERFEPEYVLFPLVPGEFIKSSGNRRLVQPATVVLRRNFVQPPVRGEFIESRGNRCLVQPATVEVRKYCVRT